MMAQRGGHLLHLRNPQDLEDLQYNHPSTYSNHGSVFPPVREHVYPAPRHNYSPYQPATDHTTSRSTGYGASAIHDTSALVSLAHASLNIRTFNESQTSTNGTYNQNDPNLHLSQPQRERGPQTETFGSPLHPQPSQQPQHRHRLSNGAQIVRLPSEPSRYVPIPSPHAAPQQLEQVKMHVQLSSAPLQDLRGQQSHPSPTSVTHGRRFYASSPTIPQPIHSGRNEWSRISPENHYSVPYEVQTIDPRQVQSPLHEQEYQLRREAAEAARIAKASPTVNTKSASTAQSALSHTSVAGVARKADPEEEMRLMFVKMRQFHEKDPELLAKIWAEERAQHVQDLNSTPSNTRSKHRAPGLSAVKPTSRPEQAPAKPDPLPAALVPQTSTAESRSKVQPGSRPANWTQERKSLFTKVLIDNVQALPGNKRLKLDPAQVSIIYDQNPDYVQLCEALERLGARVDKHALARALKLSDTPAVSLAEQGRVLADSLNARYSQAKSLPQLPARNGIPSQNAGPSTGRQQAQPVAVQSFGQIPSRDKREPPTAIPASRRTVGELELIRQFNSQSQRTESLVRDGQPRSALKERRLSSAGNVSTLGKKEQMARKRNFDEFVDLVTDGSEDELSLNYKRTDLSTGSDIPDPNDQGATAHAKNTNGLPSQATKDTLYGPAKSVPESADGQSQSKGIASQSHPMRSREIAGPLSKAKARRRASYDPRTIARDILLAAGRHPEMRQLNAHLAKLRDGFHCVNSLTDLSTIRWDILDPGGPLPGSGSIRTIQHADESDDHQDADDEIDSYISANHQPRVNTGSSAVVSGWRTTNGLPKAKGVRPKNYDVGHSSRPNTPGRSSTTKPGATPSRQAPGTSSAGPATYTALRAAEIAANPDAVKRRGRPVGWRKWMQNTPSDKTSGKVQAQQMTVAPEARYAIYACRWKDCKAQLHNLATLRKHLHKLHSKRNSRGQLDCKWHGCNAFVTLPNVSGVGAMSEQQYLAFDDESKWKDHVEEAHISPIAWELGDGPTGGLSDHHDSEVSDAYLSDSHGRRVTPQVNIPPSSSTPTTVAMFNAATNRKPDEQRAREAMDELRKRRREIGPGIDQGGARLANEKRRAGLIDDEEECQIIDDDTK